MPRRCRRATLECGLKLDINRLLRRGFIQSGTVTGPLGIKWTNSYFDEDIATGVIRANLAGTDEGWLRIELGGCDAWIILVARKRHFGGRQWFFSARRATTAPWCSGCRQVPADLLAGVAGAGE